MKRFSLATLAISAIVAVSSIIPAEAMPITNQPAQVKTDVEQARVVIKYGNWRGHRGYRHQRRGYRRHSDGFWYPLAAFGAGVAIGTTVNRGGGWRAHVNWCRDRYVTYRRSDNSYMANSGVRRVCNSPYR